MAPRAYEEPAEAGPQGFGWRRRQREPGPPGRVGAAGGAAPSQASVRSVDSHPSVSSSQRALTPSQPDPFFPLRIEVMTDNRLGEPPRRQERSGVTIRSTGHPDRHSPGKIAVEMLQALFIHRRDSAAAGAATPRGPACCWPSAGHRPAPDGTAWKPESSALPVFPLWLFPSPGYHS